MLGFYLLSYVLSTLWSTFYTLSWTNLLTRATVPAACFLLFFVPGKSENEYSRNWTGQKPKSVFHRGTPGARIRDGEGLGPSHPTWQRGLGLAALGGGLAAPDYPSVSLFAYKLPSDLKTQGGFDVFPERVLFPRHHQIPRFRTRNSVLAPCRDRELEEIIAIIITIASPSTIHVSPIYE